MSKSDQGEEAFIPAFLRCKNAASKSFTPSGADEAEPLRRHIPTPVVRSELNVRGRVKFYSQDKGFGFVRFGDNSQDAFMHATFLTELGLATLLPDSVVVCDVGYDDRDRCRVIGIHSVDESTAPSSARSQYERQVRRTETVEPEVFETRVLVVKKFDVIRGYGFFYDPDGRDIFVHISVVHKAGLNEIHPEETYEVDVVAGEKGNVVSAIRAQS
jgi:CspA family cold shock protein